MSAVGVRGGAGVAVLLGVTLLLAVPVAAQSPVPGRVGPDPVLAAAFEGLTSLDAYRMEVWTTAPYTGDLEVGTIREVIRDDPLRLRGRVIDGGDVAFDQIVIGEDGWRQILGTTWSSMGSDGDLTPSVDSLPGRAMVLERLLEAGIALAPAGKEVVDGRATRRYHGELAAPTATPAPGEYYTQSIWGTLDLWVDAADGFLVRSVADTQATDTYAELLHVDAIRTRERTEVLAVNDASLTIEPPDLAPSPAPSPGGDPALAEMVLGAFTALDRLPSYRASLEDHTLGFGGGMDMVVLPSTSTSVQATLRMGSLPYVDILAVGDRLWRRDLPEGPWSGADPADLSCYDGPCDADELTDFGRAIDGLLDTFTLVSDAETLDGVAATHLRSTAGGQTPQVGVAPGVTDLWIANDGGHLLKLDFDGQGTRSTITISGIDDPANAVDAPPVASPAPSAAAAG